MSDGPTHELNLDVDTLADSLAKLRAVTVQLSDELALVGAARP